MAKKVFKTDIEAREVFIEQSLTDTSAINRIYVQSRGENLVTNGSALMGNSYNFSDFDFDNEELFAGGGSMKYVGKKTILTEEFIPLNPSLNYRLSAYSKNGNADGSLYDSSNRQFFGIACYDIEKNVIGRSNYLHNPGSSLTFLTSALNPGDTVVNVNNLSGWNQAVSSNHRNIALYPYTNGNGFTYNDYEYTRNVENNAYPQTGIDEVNNIITLNAPWAGDSYPVNTPIKNATGGGSYLYSVLVNSTTPDDWTLVFGDINGQATDLSIADRNKFPPGTAFVRLVFLTDNTNTGSVIRYSNVELKELADAQTLESQDLDYILDYANHTNTPTPTTPVWTEASGDAARATGKVLIGQSASTNTAPLQVTDGIHQLSIGSQLFESIGAASALASGAMSIGTLTNILRYYATQHVWKNGATERMKLSSLGHLLLGTSLTGFNAKLVVSPSIFEESMLIYLNANREKAVEYKVGSTEVFRVNTLNKRIEVFPTYKQTNLGGSIEHETQDIHGNLNDFSPTGVPKEEIYERRNAAHYRNGSGTNLTHLSITTDAVNHSSGRFIMHIEGQMNNDPLDVKLIINQNDYSVIEYSNSAKLAALTFTAGLDGNNQIYVQASGTGVSFIFSCLSIHMRKHSRHDSTNPVPQITSIVVNDGSSTS